MNCCTFCSNEAEMLFNHMIYDIGSFCLECYTKLEGSCAICTKSFMPVVIQEGRTYTVEAKFVGFGDKNIIVCDSCYAEILKRY